VGVGKGEVVGMWDWVGVRVCWCAGGCGCVSCLLVCSLFVHLFTFIGFVLRTCLSHMLSQHEFTHGHLCKWI
jgi:hypothetical protein